MPKTGNFSGFEPYPENQSLAIMGKRVHLVKVVLPAAFLGGFFHQIATEKFSG